MSYHYRYDCGGTRILAEVTHTHTLFCSLLVCMWLCGDLSYVFLALQEGFSTSMILKAVEPGLLTSVLRFIPTAPPCSSISPYRTICHMGTHFRPQTLFGQTIFALNQTMFGPSSRTERSSVRRTGGQGRSSVGRADGKYFFFGRGGPMARSGAHCLRSAAASRQA